MFKRLHSVGANVTSIHLLAGMAPPHTRRTVASCVESQRQTTQASHQLYDHAPSAGRLKSRKSLMHTVTPLDSSPDYTSVQMWNNQLTDARATIKLGLAAAEALTTGSDQPGLCWRSLNRMQTGIDLTKTTMRRWGYIDKTQSVNCDCGEPQTMAHLL